MKYSGNRNSGCRFYLCQLHGHRVLFLENKYLKVAFLLDKGCDIIEFLYKPLDLDFTWRTPGGWSLLSKRLWERQDSQQLQGGYHGGWYECFPHVGVGDGKDFRGALLAEYAEACYLPWDFSVIKDCEEEVILRFEARMTKTPFFRQRDVYIKAKEARISFHEKVFNESKITLPYQWAYHPNLGNNFLKGGVELEIPKHGEMNVQWAPEGQDLASGTVGQWPNMPTKDGGLDDMRYFPELNSGKQRVINFNDLEEYFVGAWNQSQEVGIYFSWDPSVWKHLAMWQIAREGDSYPYYGEAQVLGFLPRNSKIYGLDLADKAEGHPVLGGGQAIENHMEVKISRQRKC